MAEPVKHYDMWRVRWVDENGKRRSAVYKTYEEAKFWQSKYETEAGEIKRGLRAATPTDRGFDVLCEYWLINHSSQKRSERSDRSIINVHLRPTFGKLSIREIGVEKVMEYRRARSNLNIKTVHNHLTLLISMLNVAVELKWLATAPKIKKPKISQNGEEFRYLKAREEIERFLKAARTEEDDVFVLYFTAIHTGMRQGELAGLRWSDVELHPEKRRITVQRSFNGPTKGGEVRYIPILSPLLTVLREWRKRCPGEYVFPNKAGRMHQPSARIFQETFHRALERAGFKEYEGHKDRRSYIVFHDLRHTFASHWVMRGGSIFKLQKLLGHKDIKITMRYAHLAPNAYTEDYERFGSEAGQIPEQVPTAAIEIESHPLLQLK